jgi:hypothetical protein
MKNSSRVLLIVMFHMLLSMVSNQLLYFSTELFNFCITVSLMQWSIFLLQCHWCNFSITMLHLWLDHIIVLLIHFVIFIYQEETQQSIQTHGFLLSLGSLWIPNLSCPRYIKILHNFYLHSKESKTCILSLFSFSYLLREIIDVIKKS